MQGYDVNRIVKVVPIFGALWTEIVPPWPSTMDFARGSPRPIPGVSEEWLLR